MTKNDIINDVLMGLTGILNVEQLDIVKATFIVKMQNFEIHELCTLPSTEVKDNSFILRRFQVDMLAKGVKESSIKAYMNIIRPFLDETCLNYNEVTAQHITDYLAVRKIRPNVNGKRNSASYISNINRVLFIFFQWAYRKHHIDIDIMRDVDRIRPKQKKKERITQEEIEACREAVKDSREKALLELMLSTGLRVSEIANLKIEDIDLHSRKVNVVEGKSESAERTVYLTIKARNAISRYIGERRSGYLFRPTKNLSADNAIGTGTLEKIAKGIGQRAGCHCVTTVHVYRKTFASEEYRRTSNIKYVSILLGHADTQVTEKYYLIDEMKDVEYQALYAA